MTSGWRVLPLSTKSNLGSLLFRLEISSISYDIYLTNLTDFWTESLDRKQIIRRALDQNTSIDPSEGPDQFALLLDNIRGALEGRSLTSLNISRLEKDSSLSLEVVAVLPEPLAQLRWSMHLTPASKDILSRAFIRPCLADLKTAKVEVMFLRDQIKEKDNVISKLLDKFETAGIELRDVFPNVVSYKKSRGSSRQHFMTTVKGLKQLDERDWRCSIPAQSDEDLQALCLDLFGGDTATAGHISKREYEGEVMPHKGSLVRTLPTGLARSSSGSSSSNGDFQKQVTPSRDAQHPSKLTPTKSPNSSNQGFKRDYAMPGIAPLTGSDTDDNLDEPTMRHRKPALEVQNVHNTGAKRLGLLGGKHKAQTGTVSSDAKPSISRTNTKKSRLSYSPEPTSRVLQSPRAVQAKSKLGKIGGKHESITASDATEGNAEASGSDRFPTTTKGPSPIESSERLGRQSSRRSPSPSVPRETSQERADRKRVQLRCELEEKSKAPIRKKRKF